MSNVTEVTKELTLDLTDIPEDRVKDAKDDVKAYLINQILRDVNSGVSPVSGEGRFRILTPDYAREEKGGIRTANLELDGDLLNALKARDTATDKIEVGIRGRQAPKADGHNQISEEAKAWAQRTGRKKYKRRFIPDEGQTFKRSIMRGIDNILDEYREAPEVEEVQTVEGSVTNIDTSTGAISSSSGNSDFIGVDSLFSDDNIAGLLAEAIRKRDGGL